MLWPSTFSLSVLEHAGRVRCHAQLAEAGRERERETNHKGRDYITRRNWPRGNGSDSHYEHTMEWLTSGRADAGIFGGPHASPTRHEHTQHSLV